jgi:hypothetical protein
MFNKIFGSQKLNTKVTTFTTNISDRYDASDFNNESQERVIEILVNESGNSSPLCGEVYARFDSCGVLVLIY